MVFSKQRLYEAMIVRQLADNRSQTETLIKLGKVRVNGLLATSPNETVALGDKIIVTGERYVSRAAYKLASAVPQLKLVFKDKVILDVGASTGGFTDYALQHGAQKVIAVDVGTDQMVPALSHDERVELHEKTDIRSVVNLSEKIDMVVVDVSFISLQLVLPHIKQLIGNSTPIVAMVKPQFEAGHSNIKHKGVIKNDKMRREVLKNFETWVTTEGKFIVRAKADSDVSGNKGNIERFYLLLPAKK